MRIRRLKPSEVRFSCDFINSKFDSGVKIGDVLDNVIWGGYTYIKRFPMLNVVRKNGQYYTKDNQQLWIYKVAESVGVFNDVLVKYHPPHSRFAQSVGEISTESDGVCIRIKGNPHGIVWRKSIPYLEERWMCFNRYNVKFMECVIVNNKTSPRSPRTPRKRKLMTASSTRS
ncbi:hypothetical protein FSP39_019272 [Pinctada imbricata]|uniref:Uncharacterized protein n=1 Tax=Pinctada imbricata TaxID=66713 RepID=A0AA88XDM3_PINIB|nr:hypothetical protein FSP39_019272 [Pinctada imbricata]